MARSAIDATDATLDQPLPDELGEHLQMLFDRPERPETVADWVDAVTAAVHDQFDREIGVDDLCHVPESEHVTAVLDGDGDVTDRYHFACFYDGLVLTGMTDDPVRVRTQCPETGEPITFEGTLDDLTSDAAVVVSIGVANDPVPHGDTDADGTGSAAPSFDHVYGATCPYVNAFASAAAYESWTETVDAATTALTPAVALAAARALTA